MGEGTEIRVSTEWALAFKTRRAWNRLIRRPAPEARIVTIPNPIEDFPDDGIFVAWLARLRAMYADRDQFTLRLGGDCFDALAVRWCGGFSDPLTERVAVAKMRKIMAGHRRAFDALATFVRRSNARLVIFVGNHDQFLVWLRVQRVIVRRLFGGASPQEAVAIRRRISFVDHRRENPAMRFREVDEDGFVYDHGMNMEAHNFVDPAAPIIHEVYGRRLDEPVLNEPPASFMCRMLANPTRSRKPLIGRVNNTAVIWLDALTHDLSWVLRITRDFLVLCVGYMVSSLFDPSKRFNPLKFFKVVLTTLGLASHRNYAARVAAETGADKVVMGHTHEPEAKMFRDEAGRTRTDLNSGTFALQKAVEQPKFPRTWRRFLWLERLWHAFLHFLRHRESKISQQVAKIAVFIAFIWLALTFLMRTFSRQEWGEWAERFTTFKWPLSFVLCLAVASAVLRFVSVKPHIRDFRLLTFVIVTREKDGTMDYGVHEYLPETDVIRKFG